MTVDSRINDLIDAVQYDKGLINRSIFVDRDVYELELERLFANTWLFLGHVSQVAEPGDFITTYMGEDSVIVSRGHDGRVRALLNSCRHRGMRVCRSDEGNTSFFKCPYHAWTYSSAGELEGVPKFRLATPVSSTRKSGVFARSPGSRSTGGSSSATGRRRARRWTSGSAN